MSDWAKEQGKKFQRYLFQERIKDLKLNPYVVEAVKQKKPIDDPDVIEEAAPKVEAWVKSNRAGAYIFGDSYDGMPVDDAIKMLMDEEFGPQTRLPNGLIRFKHDYLGLATTPRLTEDGERLKSIIIDVALVIRRDLLNPNDLSGIGFHEFEVQGNTLYGQLDATTGLQVKMWSLRSMAASHINDPLPS